VSDAIAPVVKPITQEQIGRYADASGDHNPIHIDPGFARAMPFGGTIAHGMLVLAMAGELMTRAFGERWLAGGRLQVRFRAPARPGDTLTASASPQGRGYAVEVRNQDGDVVISGIAEVAGG
jgi:3-hydroxybutyryl-CoA dehydratase